MNLVKPRMRARALGSENSAVKASGAMVLSCTFSPIWVPADWNAVASSETSGPIGEVAMERAEGAPESAAWVLQ